MKETLLINIFGGPSIGKTDCARDLANLLGRQGFVSEYVPEFAKKLVWSQSFPTLRNQVFVTAGQFNDLLMVYGQVDYIVTDSPVLTGIAFPGVCCTPAWEAHVLEMHHHFKHVNFLLERNLAYYQAEGRVQTPKECLIADRRLEDFLAQHHIAYQRLFSASSPAQAAMQSLMSTHNRT